MTQSFDHIKIGADPDPKAWEDRGDFSPIFDERKYWRRFGNFRAGSYVNYGYFISRQLRFTSQYRPIPEYSSSITSLTTNPAGTVFGATSGENAHVFAYNRNAPVDAIAIATKFDDHQAITNAVVWEKELDVIVGTRGNENSPKDYAGGKLFRVTTPNFWVDTVQEWPREGGKTEELCTPVPGEGIATIIIDRSRGRIYGISDKTSVFFYYDLESGTVETRGELCPAWHHSEVLMLTHSGKVYGVSAAGILVCFDPDSDELKVVEAAIPSGPGRSMITRIDSAAWDPITGQFYLGDKADGTLIAFDPETLESRMLGKPTSLPRIRALTVGVDGRVFGFAGDKDDMGQFFVYDPQTAELRNLGIPMSTIEEKRYGLSFSSATTGPQGEIYLGEDESSARLFTYFPPQKAPEPCDCGCY